jgi:hypothetical protein
VETTRQAVHHHPLHLSPITISFQAPRNNSGVVDGVMIRVRVTYTTTNQLGVRGRVDVD